MCYFVRRLYSVCILDKNTQQEHFFKFDTIYPYPDGGWFTDLEEFLLDKFGDEVDYELMSFCLEM